MKLPSLPIPGETVVGGTCSFCLGGKGANQAVAAARAGAEVFFISSVGTDHVAHEVKQELKNNNVALNGIIDIEKTETGKAMIFVDDEGQNCIGVADGANAYLTPELLRNYAEDINKSDLVLLQMEIPQTTVIEGMKLAQSCEKKVILNPAPATHFDMSLLTYVSILTPNKSEIELISGQTINDETTLKKTAQLFLRQGLEKLIITLGEQGVFVFTQEEEFKKTAFKVNAVDTTAAGDVFNGSLAFALASDASLHEALEFAMAASALSVQKAGAIPSIPYKSEVDTFLSSQQ